MSSQTNKMGKEIEAKKLERNVWVLRLTVKGNRIGYVATVLFTSIQAQAFPAQDVDGALKFSTKEEAEGLLTCYGEKNFTNNGIGVAVVEEPWTPPVNPLIAKAKKAAEEAAKNAEAEKAK